MSSSELSHYLTDVSEIYRSGAGVKETSYYPALTTLLSGVGKEISPRVRPILNPANRGAGIPDGGFYTPDQFPKGEQQPLSGTLPSRGVLEVKGTAEEVAKIVAGAQVQKYLDLYGTVLVTNLRHFALVVKGADGKPRTLEEYRLAPDEKTFWQAAQHPKATLEQHEVAFGEYLQRSLLHRAPLSTPKDLAWFLASYARQARAVLEGGHLPQLVEIRKAFGQALDLKFEGEKGESFFRSTLVQTLFYGLFSAWVLHHQEGKLERFSWKTAAWDIHLPLLQKLFEELTKPSAQRGLGLTEIMDWATETLERVDKTAFFAKFELAEAVQYFYEPFLEAYDPELRKQFGVWYTPSEIVKYMVERVDRALREDLGIARGLADPSVYVLDPCTGTGSYLAEVVRRIHRTLEEEGELDALSSSDLKSAIQGRIFGFEIMPAPYVVAHLQLGLLLSQLGSPLSGDERAGVYLTNALTGWEPNVDKRQFIFDELREEFDAAQVIKQEKPVLVVLGNPPYNAFAGVATLEEQGMVAAYKEGLISQWGIKKFNLDDLYVRFFRLAERRISKTGRGIVAYISPFSYLSDPSYVVMRRKLLETFDTLRFDSLNGDSRETGKTTPDGLPDPSVFSTQWNKAGIRVGTSIGVMIRKEARADAVKTVQYREFWGASKRSELLESLDASSHPYETAHPNAQDRFSFRPSSTGTDYMDWPRVSDLCELEPIQGLDEDRGFDLIDVDKANLEERIQLYFDKTIPLSSLTDRLPGLTRNSGEFIGKDARGQILCAESFSSSKILEYVLKPFDVRWCYYSTSRPMWKRPRPGILERLTVSSGFIVTRSAAAASDEGITFMFSTHLIARDSMKGHAVAIPILLKSETQPQPSSAQSALFAAPQAKLSTRANLSKRARAYLEHLGAPDPDGNLPSAKLLWLHALAVGYSPRYRLENADGIKSDYPRIPLPAILERLQASATLGSRIADLLDGEKPSFPENVKGAGKLSRKGGGQLSSADLEVTASWGNPTKTGVMPGRGLLERRGEGSGEVVDVYLNAVAYWADVPSSVWDYTIGGYQVLKKWLSYRDARVLKRALTNEEAREFSSTVKRLAALVALEAELDANYDGVLEGVWAWGEEILTTPQKTTADTSR